MIKNEIARAKTLNQQKNKLMKKSVTWHPSKVAKC